MLRHPINALKSGDVKAGIVRLVKDAGSHRLAGAMTKEQVQARLSRAFWAKQVVQGLTENQMLSLLFSGQLSPRPFQVYQGKDKEGRDVFQNIVFRGSAGDAVSLGTKMSERGLAGAGVFVGSKAAPFTKAGIHALTGRDDMGHEIAPKGLGFAVNSVRTVGSFITDVSPIPITIRNVHRTMVGDGSDEYLWSERVMGLIGPQAQHVAPEGMRMTKHGLRGFHRQKPAREFWEQVRTGRP